MLSSFLGLASLAACIGLLLLSFVSPATLRAIICVVEFATVSSRTSSLLEVTAFVRGSRRMRELAIISRARAFEVVSAGLLGGVLVRESAAASPCALALQKVSAFVWSVGGGLLRCVVRSGRGRGASHHSVQSCCVGVLAHGRCVCCCRVGRCIHTIWV